jgi:hypothetical protein
MSRGSVAILATLTAVLALTTWLPPQAVALSVSGSLAHPATVSPGYGKGAGYCSAYGNHASGYSFAGVYACATTNSVGPTPFDSDGRYSFQCVELSARVLWAVYGIWAGPGTGVDAGANLVAVVHRLDPGIGVGYPGPRSVPLRGDIISLGPGGAVDARFGHTAVVVAANQRTGFVTIISQNFPAGHAGQQTLRVGLKGRHDGRVLINGTWTRASWLELRRPPRHHRRRRRS